MSSEEEEEMIREVKRIRLDSEKMGYEGVNIRGDEGDNGDREVSETSQNSHKEDPRGKNIPPNTQKI